MRKTLRNYALIAAMLLASVVTFAQSKITGTVVDAETGEGLPGASVFIKGTSNGTITDYNGAFTLSVEEKNVTVVVSFVGFKTVEKAVDLSSSQDLGSISLEYGSDELSPVEVLASVAQERKTPVAVSAISKELILERASNQEFPELLKSTPGVYATKAGGGYGDSRINLRGFNSENVAVLINGVPVNDMENGKVYWSNWAGLTDVTKSMQVQRGLGASKVAVPSIGGTINIMTQTTDVQRGGNVYTGIGNDNYKKNSFYVSTGLSEKGWAVSLSGAKITGDGYVNGTEFVGYNYFFNISKQIGDSHTLSLTGFGAPQNHGQRQSSLSVEEVKEYGLKYNKDYGYLDGQVVHVEDNFYHKPQFSLNHYWDINSKTELSTALYVSTGTGGGGGTGGTLQKTSEGLYDLEATRDANIANSVENGGDGSAVGFLRASRNDHRWYGLLSTLTNETSSNLTITGGVDLRYYKGIHFSEVTNLLGADYVLDDYDVNNPNRRLKVGDKRQYHDDGIVLWEGLFGQAEYDKGDLSVFVSGAVSNTSYKRIDYYLYTPGNQETDFESFIGFQAKGGANYNLNRYHNVFINAGYFTKAPSMSDVYLNDTNELNEDAKMQSIVSYEVGYGFRLNNKFNANVNLYHTTWMDRSFVESLGNGNTANLSGVDATHMGVEVDMKYKPVKSFTLTGMVSLGDWTWKNDVRNVYVYDDDRNVVAGPIDLYISGLKVGNSAQTTAAIGANYEFLKGFKIGANLNYYADNYKDYDPNDVTDPDEKSTVLVVVPEYYNLDLNANYKFKIGNLNATAYGNVNNVLDAEYITDWSSYGVYVGTGRQWTTGLRINF